MRDRLHTADHILCTFLDRKTNAKTRAMEFREYDARITFECKQDLREMKSDIEKEVNSLIKKGLEVKNYTLPREKAKEITDLSLVPSTIPNISIYEIAGFNKVACVGPHVKNTREIGNFEIIKIEKTGKDSYSVKYTVK